MPRNSTIYKIGGTDTFRLASSKILGKWGGNLQNIEKSMREIYHADEGKILLQCDQSGAEALIMSYLMKPGNKLRQMFDAKIKPHVYLGTMFPDQWISEFPAVKVFAEMPIKELPSHPDWSAFAKAVADSDLNPPATRYYYHYKQSCHSGNYRITAPTFRLNILEKSGGKVVLTLRQAEQYVSGYQRMIPELLFYWEEVGQFLYRTKILYNLFGFPREFTGEINESMMKEAYAFIPQSTVGTITNVAYTNLQNYIEANKLEWDLLANTHDSYLVQCPMGEEFECAKQMKYFMEQELTSPRGEKFRMRSEVACGNNWSPYHEKKNPNGLKELKV